MQVHSIVFNPFFENTYVVSNESKEAIIVDPGCYEPYETKQLENYVAENDLKIIAIVNTHCHIDHVLGNWAMKKAFGVDLYVPMNEKETLNAIPSYAPSYGFTGYQPAVVDVWYSEGNFPFWEDFQLIEVPGHSPGHMVFYHEKEKILIGGDVLFRESIGRTDLPGGNHDQLLSNIREKVYTLPEDVTVYPGHGPETTIGHEKQFNPFVRG